jgi:AcrR family transcriptional regulator
LAQKTKQAAGKKPVKKTATAVKASHEKAGKASRQGTTRSGKMPVRRDEILDAARSLYNRFGYRKTTVDEIAHAAGVTKPTIYAYFNGKEDVLLSLIEREASRVLDTGMAAAPAGAGAQERLAAIFLSTDSFLSKDPFLQGIVSRDPDVLTPEVVQVAFDFERRIISAIAAILEEGMAEGVFRRTDPELMAYALVRLHEAFTFSSFDLARNRGKINNFFVETVIATLRP